MLAAAIPITLGAGESTGTGALCTAGAAPPLTSNGAAFLALSVDLVDVSVLGDERGLAGVLSSAVGCSVSVPALAVDVSTSVAGCLAGVAELDGIDAAGFDAAGVGAGAAGFGCVAANVCGAVVG